MPKRSFPHDGTQGYIVLNALLNAQGDWVGLHKLMRLASDGSVHSTVSGLRRVYGADILNHTERSSGRRKRSKYRLLNPERFSQDSAVLKAKN